MKKKEHSFSFAEYDSIDDLSTEDADLLLQARQISSSAYAPYSQFMVGAAALLENGETVKGTNQENASYPVGICAERTLLAAAGTIFPGMPIEAMAISYSNKSNSGDYPILPCGMCRQALMEFEDRTQKPVRLILGGHTGHIFIINRASDLLPLAFTGKELK
ncbi:MAG: cytidine deaminase [Chitinophagaceae bacterium]|nr:cytidine deaminase [Chitinophagaceae bacterium]